MFLKPTIDATVWCAFLVAPMVLAQQPTPIPNATSPVEDGGGGGPDDSIRWAIFGAVAGGLGIPLMCLCAYFVHRNRVQRQRLLEVQQRRQVEQSQRIGGVHQTTSDGSLPQGCASDTVKVFDFSYTPTSSQLPQQASFVGPAIEVFDERVLRPISSSSSGHKFGSHTSGSSTGSMGMRRKPGHGGSGPIAKTGSGGRLTSSSPRLPRLPSHRGSDSPANVSTTVALEDVDDADEAQFDLPQRQGTVTINVTAPPATQPPISASEVSLHGSRKGSQEY